MELVTLALRQFTIQATQKINSQPRSWCIALIARKLGVDFGNDGIGGSDV